jgi:hypothetical protein
VSEVEDWILVNRVHYAMEMERSLRLMMERLFAKQSQEMEAKAEARHDKACAKIEACLHSMRSDIERSVQKQMGALLEGSKSFGTRTTICRVPPVTCQRETMSCPEEMDTMRLESTLEEIEAVVEWQKLRENEINAESIGSSEERYGEQCLPARRR